MIPTNNYDTYRFVPLYIYVKCCLLLLLLS